MVGFYWGFVKYCSLGTDIACSFRFRLPAVCVGSLNLRRRVLDSRFRGLKSLTKEHLTRALMNERRGAVLMTSCDDDFDIFEHLPH